MNDLSSAPETIGAARRAGVKIYDRPHPLAVALRRPHVWLALLGVVLGGAVTYYSVVAT